MAKAHRIIYGLFDPLNGELRYIGKSEYGISRLYRHLAPSSIKNECGHKANWIRSLLKMGMKPYLKILREVSSNEDLSIIEIETISFYRNVGSNLTNLTNGGEGMTGYIPSLETRNKLSKSRIGKTIDSNTRLKMSKSRSGAKHHFYGKTCSDSRKQAISKSLVGRTLGKKRNLIFKNTIALARGSSPFVINKNEVMVGTFVSLREAERITGIHRKIIKLILLGVRPQINGYTFKYG